MLGRAIALLVIISGMASAETRYVTPVAMHFRLGHLRTPIQSNCISSPFGPRIIPDHPQAGTYHNGIDLPAPEGSEVRATSAGKVSNIHNGGPGGLEVLVQHDGYVGVYSHLGLVQTALNKHVVAGEILGLVGHTGVTFGMHLHFEMLINNRPIDPAPYFDISLCNGGHHQPSIREIVMAGGKIPPTHHYLLHDSGRF